ncbi:MAG: MATE family efflux transporter, partial [Deltaproteobacteria bacterium]|nr:MATE family efflux transporter [Deltaproteobacteria bacterium]
MFFQTLFLWFLRNLKELNPKTRWNAPQGYKEVLSLALPLIASTAASSLMLFTDRIFLSNYSPSAIAASLPAGVAKVAVTSLFIGICSYVGVFVAQYIGAGKPHRTAATLWQGIYFAIGAGLLLSLLYFASDFIFSFGTQDPEVLALELSYFNLLIIFSPFDLGMVVMSAFLSSMGRAKAVMWVSLIGAGFNVPMNYLLIYGLKLGSLTIFPQWGIFGAALATVMSWVLSVIIYSALIFTKKMERDFQVRSNRKFDWELTFRLLKFGWPGGLQFFMEIFAFAFFSFAVGHLTVLELTCNNIVFSLEILSFFPMIGVGTSVSILVGQAIGRGKPLEGARSVKTGTALSTVYVLMIAIMFISIPRPLLSLFLASDYEPEFINFIYELGSVILVYVAIYSVSDGLYLCCFGAIKGAGDVWFPMGAMAVWGIFGLMMPVLLLL